MTKQIKFIEPTFPAPENLIKDIKRIVKSGIYTNMGPFEKEFESKISNYLDKSGKLNTIAVANATLGLLISIKTFFKDSGYVLLPSFTFAATIEAVLWNNLTPIFVDIDPHYWSMKISNDTIHFLKKKKIAGILFCNPFGIPGKIVEWERLSDKLEVPMIIDSAAGIGSTYISEEKLGGKADAEIFSLHITKAFGIGEGGLITTYNDAASARLQKTKNFGFDEKHIVRYLGINAKLSEISSAIALRVLNSYENDMVVKKNLIEKYLNKLNPQIVTHPNIRNAYPQFFPAIFKNKTTRKRVQNSLIKNNIQFRRYYVPSLHSHFAFKKVDSVEDLINTESISERIITLPLHLKLTKKDLEFIISTVNSSL